MLPRAARLRKERDFRAVFSRSQSAMRQSSATRTRIQSSPMLALHVKPKRDPIEQPDGTAPQSMLRFGITISKKVAKRSHDRNRLKRRLSEIARLVIVPAYDGYGCIDCVVVARQPAVEADYATLQQEFLDLAARARIYRYARFGSMPAQVVEGS